MTKTVLLVVAALTSALGLITLTALQHWLVSEKRSRKKTIKHILAAQRLCDARIERIKVENQLRQARGRLRELMAVRRMTCGSPTALMEYQKAARKVARLEREANRAAQHAMKLEMEWREAK